MPEKINVLLIETLDFLLSKYTIFSLEIQSSSKV